MVAVPTAVAASIPDTFSKLSATFVSDNAPVYCPVKEGGATMLASAISSTTMYVTPLLPLILNHWMPLKASVSGSAIWVYAVPA